MDKRQEQGRSACPHALLEAVLQASGDLVFALDADGQIVRHSAACEDATGYSGDELNGRSFWDLLPPEEARGERGLLERLRAGRETAPHRTDLVRRDGTRGRVQWFNAVVPAGGGEPIRLVCIGRDVTSHVAAGGESARAREELAAQVAERTAELARANERMRREVRQRELAARAMEDSERRFRLLVEQMPAVTYVSNADEDPTRLYVSPQVEDVLGFGAEEFIVRPELWSRQLHPDDRERVKAELAEAHAGGESFTSEYRILTRDRRVLWVRDTASPLHDPSDGSALYQGVLQDVTDLKRAESLLRASEERYRTIVETSSEGVWLMDEHGRTLFVNQRMADLLGLAPDDMLDRSFEEFVAEGWRDIARRNSLRRRRGVVEQYDFKLRRRDGTYLWALVSASPVVSADGRYAGALGMVTDITDRKHDEERLQRYQRRLRSLASELSLTEERERRSMAAYLHEQLGQILATAKLRLQMLQGRPHADDLNGEFQQVVDLVDRALRGTRSLTFELMPPHVYELGLAAALEWLTERFAERESIRATFRDDGAPKSLADSLCVVLFCAARELLSNVARHAAAAEVLVAARLQGDEVVVSVQDDGCGFDNVVPEGDVAVHGRFGLFNIRERLDLLGGRLEITTPEGGGTRAALVAPAAAGRD